MTQRMEGGGRERREEEVGAQACGEKKGGSEPYR